MSGTAYRCARRRDDDAGERRPAGKVWEAKTAGNKDLNMKVTAVSVTLLMRTIPATTPDIAVFAKLRDRRQYGECSLVLAADGARVELERRTDLVGYLGAAIDLKTLSSVAAATRVAGRLCDQEFVLEPGALTVLRDFVLRVRETTALLPSPSASPAEEVVDVAPAAPAVQGEITQP